VIFDSFEDMSHAPKWRAFEEGSDEVEMGSIQVGEVERLVDAALEMLDDL